MNSKLAQEKMLYESLVKTTSDRDFVISFQDYFLFILEQHDNLCVHLYQPLAERFQEQAEIEELYKNIINNVQETIKEIEALSKKLKIQDDPIIKDSLQSIKNFLNGKGFVIDGEKIDSMFLETLDITRRLYELGFKKELSPFVEFSPDGNPVVESIFTFKNRKEFLLAKNNFNKKDKRTLAGVFSRLTKLYFDIQGAENFVPKEVKIENFLERFHDDMREKEYTSLMENKISQGSHFKKDHYQNDIDRLHQSIVINNPELTEKTDGNDKIFWIDGDDIYHYKIGKMNYRKRGSGDPNYIRAFKNVINYVPTGTVQMGIFEFKNRIHKTDRFTCNYRTTIGRSARSFIGFLKKNKVKNIHPKNNIEILDVTDDYVTFLNNPSSV